MANEPNRARIDAMYSNDRTWAWASVAALWLSVLFVLLMVWPLVSNQGVHIALVIAAALLLIFNTASILAMVRHYSEDRNNIYGLDIFYSDKLRK